MEIATLTLRVVLTLIFAVAALTKVRNLSELPGAASQLGITNQRLARLAVMLPFAEAVLAALLLSPLFRPAAAAAVVLLAFFTFLVWRTLRTGERPTCHCFGSRTTRPIGKTTLVRNALLLLTAIAVAIMPGAEWRAFMDPPGEWTAADAILVWIVLLQSAIIALLFLLTWRAIGLSATSDSRGVDVTSGAGSAPKRPGIGSPAPAFQSPLASGDPTKTLASLASNFGPLALLFVHEDCGACSSLIEQLAEDYREHRLARHLVFLSPHLGPSAEPLLTCGGEGRAWTIVQTTVPLLELYAAPGTPSLVLVSDAGLLESPVISGAGAILSLLRGDQGQPHPASASADLADVTVGVPDGSATLKIADVGPSALLINWAASCQYCRDLIPDLISRRLDAEPVVLMGPGSCDVGAPRTFCMEFDAVLARALRLSGTPVGALLNTKTGHFERLPPGVAGLRSRLA